MAPPAAFAAAKSDTRLFDYVDKVLDIANSANCLGCPFQGTAAEFADASHPAHAAAIKVKRDVIATLIELSERQGIADPKRTAEVIYLLLEGIWASVSMFGENAPLAVSFQQAARKLAAA